jgi:hypothetical protein
VNLQQSIERQSHPASCTEIYTITSIDEGKKSFSISAGGMGFSMSKLYGVIPKVGQTVTLYTFQGCSIRGIDLDGQPVFFKSKTDLEADRQKALKRIEVEKAKRKVKFFREQANPKSDFNRRLARLPRVFQQRFAKFFRLGEDFWDLAWYELVACETAVKIAYACKSRKGIRRFRNLGWEKQGELIPDIDDGLSGNQMGFAYAVAGVYLREPKLVRKVIGAMSPLTGSRPYIGR